MFKDSMDMDTQKKHYNEVGTNMYRRLCCIFVLLDCEYIVMKDLHKHLKLE